MSDEMRALNNLEVKGAIVVLYYASDPLSDRPQSARDDSAGSPAWTKIGLSGFGPNINIARGMRSATASFTNLYVDHVQTLGTAALVNWRRKIPCCLVYLPWRRFAGCRREKTLVTSR